MYFFNYALKPNPLWLMSQDQGGSSLDDTIQSKTAEWPGHLHPMHLLAREQVVMAQAVNIKTPMNYGMCLLRFTQFCVFGSRGMEGFWHSLWSHTHFSPQHLMLPLFQTPPNFTWNTLVSHSSGSWGEILEWGILLHPTILMWYFLTNYG